MDTLTWNEIVEAIEAYRACPEQEQFEALRRALTGCTFYVPVGDFDGNNAVISPLSSAQGGSFIPLYADQANVQPSQHSEGVSPQDWKHILGQLSHVDGCVLEPYSVNFAFDRRFVDALVEAEGTDAQLQTDGLDKVRQSVEGEQSVNGASAVHAWPPSGSASSAEASSVENILADTNADASTFVHIEVPTSVPASLHEAMQAVSDEFSALSWLFTRKYDGDEQGYLMVLDVSPQWFDENGAEAVNNVLGRFQDPGLPLDFVARESDLGACAQGHAPHYYPNVQADKQEKQNLHEQAHGLFRRLFKR